MPLFVALAAVLILLLILAVRRMFVALAAVLILLLILAVRRRVEARRLVRLYHAPEAWAEGLDREGSRAA